jgi:hypothetical protein
MFSRVAGGDMFQATNHLQIDGLPLTNNGGLKVELVPMPAGDNPWRTHAEYLIEQRRDTIRFYVIIASLVISAASVALTALIAIATIKDLS